MGVVSVVVQGGLLRLLLKRLEPRQLAVMGLLSSTLAYAAWGAAWSGWVMYAVIFTNLLGYTVMASLQSIVSGAAREDEQGQTLGSVSSINSLTAVIAPVLTAPLLMAVSHLPPGDWRIGAPLYFGAVLQATGLAKAYGGRPLFQGVDLALRRLDATAEDTAVTGEHVVLPAQLVTRTSTAPVPAAP